ncbi:MAG: TRL domain-containing protein [Candidatus Sumerlaeia bacterium]
MARKLALLFCMAALLTTAGCGMYGIPKAPLMPPVGIIYTDIKAPLQAKNDWTLDYHNTPVNPGKTGTSSCIYVGIPFYPMLSVALMDPATVETAAKSGGLNEVEYADYQFFTVLGVFSRFTVNAYGR